MREAKPAKQLMITLLYLAPGDSFKNLEFPFSLRLFQFPGIRASQILKFSNYVSGCKIWLINASKIRWSPAARDSLFYVPHW